MGLAGMGADDVDSYAHGGREVALGHPHPARRVVAGSRKPNDSRRFTDV
jgi:hypothetical protein